MRVIHKIILGFICLKIGFIFALPALDVTVDRSKIIENTSFRLFVELKDKSFRGTPDFSILQKEFRVLSTIKSRSSSWINGKKSSSVVWQFVLMPNRIGKITIPKLHVADLSSKQFAIEVIEANSDTVVDEKPRLARMEAKINKLDPVVQSMVILNIKLHYARNLSAEYLSEPVFKDAIVLPLGRDKRYREDNSGVVFYIFERNYAIFPQKSGKVTIGMPIFDGIFDDDRSGFGNFDNVFKININSMPVRATAPDITLDVKEAPVNEGLQYWLPALDLKINQEWESKGKLKQGEPIVRKITIKTSNLTAEQIPNLIDYEINGANHYINPPDLENTTQNLEVLGKRVDNITYIPTTDGEIVFPEIKIKWWDTGSKTFKFARVPGKKFKILPIPKPDPKPEDIELPTEVAKQPRSEETMINSWMYVAIGLIVLWLLTILSWLYMRRKPRSHSNKKGSSGKLSVKDLYKEVENNCLSNIAHEANKYILQLASKKTNTQITSLAMLEQYVSKETIEEFRELERTIYSDNTKNWHGAVLWQLIKEESFTKTARESEDDDLPPLNPG